jgi:hypothetical protein
MISNPLRRVANWVVGVGMGLMLLQCAQQPAVLGDKGSGGSKSNGGQGGSGTSATSDPDAAVGGAVGKDGPVVSVNLDVIPIWWGEADAPQGPETLATPSEDANCGITSGSTTRKPVDVLLVLDRSASMNYSIAQDCYCATTAGTPGTLCADTSNCTTRWDSIKPAVTTTLSGSKYVNWGLKFFPSGGSTGFGASNCTVNTNMEVPVSDTAATQVESQVNGATLVLGTPTAAALTAATNYLKSLNDGNDKFILLATDGEPNCGKSDAGTADINVTDVPGASDAAGTALAAGFPVYVIGIGPNLGNLTDIAKAGGTTDFYPVSSPDQLAAALSSISKVVGSCTFHSDEPPKDPDNVAVYVNKEQINKDPNNGWKYGATNQDIVLTGSYCDDITAGKDTTVQILFGCPGAPPVPPFVP